MRPRPWTSRLVSAWDDIPPVHVRFKQRIAKPSKELRWLVVCGVAAESVRVYGRREMVVCTAVRACENTKAGFELGTCFHSFAEHNATTPRSEAPCIAVECQGQGCVAVMCFPMCPPKRLHPMGHGTQGHRAAL